MSKTAGIPLEDKTLAIKSIQIPRNLKELRSFFGSTNQSVSDDHNLAIVFEKIGSESKNRKYTLRWQTENKS